MPFTPACQSYSSSKAPAKPRRRANVFASTLLLPGDDLRAVFRSRFERGLASRSREHGLDAVRKRLDDPSFRRMDGASVPKLWTKRPPDLPDQFVRLVASACRAGDLSRSVAAKYLERNPGELYYSTGTKTMAGRTRLVLLGAGAVFAAPWSMKPGMR